MNLAKGKRMLLVLLRLLAIALCLVILACRRPQVRPANVPATAVPVNGNYVNCISHDLPGGEVDQHPCTVYSGSTGEVLNRDALEERLRAVASGKGGSAIDCGRSSTIKLDGRISECVQTAFQNGKAFFVRYDNVTAFSSNGLAGDAEGNVFWIAYDLRNLPPVVPTRFTQLFDGNHNQVTSCRRPIKLGDNGEGQLGCIIPINEAASAMAAQQKPVDTTVCAVLENPGAFNNKIVRLHGRVWINFEYSMLSDTGCSGVIWFAYPGYGPPGLIMYLGRGAEPGAFDEDGKRILPVPVKLVQDSSLKRFERLLNSRPGSADRPKKTTPSGFPFHQISATFIGRIDSVSQEIHAFRLKRSQTDRPDSLGFGPMGFYDAEFVMQSVENDAVLEERSR